MHKKFAFLRFLLVFILLTGCNLENQPASQAQPANGATAWIESPLPNRVLPNENILFTVYATDPGGVSGISLSLNGAALGAYRPTSLSDDGSSRMVRMDYPWQPTGEGTYTLTAQAQGSSGSSNLASVTFCVVACQPASTTNLPTPTPAPLTATPLPLTGTSLPPTVTTPTRSPTIQVSPTTVPAPTVKFWATPPTISAGACTTLFWEVTNSANVLLDSSWQPASGSQKNCLCQTQTFTLTVQDLNGQKQNYPQLVKVTGSCNTPEPTSTQYVPPPVETEPPYVPPADTSGPEISAWLDWNSGECRAYGNASISDASGIAWAKFEYNLNGEGWKSVWMANQGGAWRSEAGVSVGDGFSSTAGEIQYRVRAADTLGNETTSGANSYNYFSCGG